MLNSLKSRLKNEYVFAILVKTLVIIVGLLRTVFWARYLGASMKGDVEYIRSISSIAFVVFAFGIYEAYPYYRKTIGKEKTLSQFMRIVYKLFVIYLCIGVAAYFVLEHHNLFLSIALLIVPILSFSRIVQYIYLIENPNKANLKTLCVNVIELLYSIVLLLLVKRSFVLAITSLFSIELLQAISSVLYLRSGGNVPDSLNGEEIITIRKLIAFGFFPMLAALLTTLNYRIDVIMLKNYSNISSANIGVYSLGITLVDKLIIIPDTLKAVLASNLSKGKGADEVARLTRICFALSICITIVAIIIAKPLISFFYGKEYEGAYTIILISAAGILFIMFFKLIAQYNIVNKKQRRNFVILSVSIIINVFMNMLLIPKLGISGAALATGIGHAICGLIFIIDFHNQSGIPYKEIVFIQKRDISQFRSK